MADSSQQPHESRVKKSLLNAKVNTICYFVAIITAFFTRRIFLEYLGENFMGLTGTLGSLLGFLNLAELGVGTAIGYVLYKPLYDRDQQKIKEVLSLLGYLYRMIGLFILGSGVILSCFLPLIFPEESRGDISMGVVFFGFYAYLTSTLVGYFANYRAMLLSADQRNYVVTGYFQIVTSVKVIVQMVLAIYVTNFYLYLAIEFVCGIINVTIVNYKINRTYPWLKTEVSQGRLLFKKYPEVAKYIRQIFLHNVSGFINYQTAPMFIYMYVSLPIVALYNNYTMVVQKVGSLVTSVVTSTGAGVGNLVAEGDGEKIYRVYRELTALRIFIGGVVTFCIYRLATGFICVWVGPQYALGEVVVAILCVQTYIGFVRPTTDEFLFAMGLFYDVWAPFVQMIISVGVTCACGYMWGLPGVILGPVVSFIIIVRGWKPFFLYTKGFHRSLVGYVWLNVRNMAPVIMAYAVTSVICGFFVTDELISSGWMGWLAGASAFTAIMGVVSSALMLAMSKDFRMVARRFDYKKLLKKLKLRK